jgi:SOS-response transcriptional repressor LexA
MAPVLVRGASVAFAGVQEPPTALDGRMVVAWVDGSPIVRWFQDQGDHGLLRAEDSKKRPVRVPLGLEGEPEAARLRRVLWIEAAR